MTPEKKLTSFQCDLAFIIEELLKSKNIQYRKNIEGKNEIYIFYECMQDNLKIWIYEDEAEFWVQNRQIICEHQDYDNEEDLKDDFIKIFSREFD